MLDDQVAKRSRAALDIATGSSTPTRVAIRGWSFGGYLAALAVLRRPDRFHAAIAGAPVTSWRSLRHPLHRALPRPPRPSIPEHYDTQRPLRRRRSDGPELATARPGRLLLIHGLADDNVVAAHTLRLSTALLATGSPHRVLPLTGVTHMTPQVAVAENLLRSASSTFLAETLSASGGLHGVSDAEIDDLAELTPDLASLGWTDELDSWTAGLGLPASDHSDDASPGQDGHRA